MIRILLLCMLLWSGSAANPAGAQSSGSEVPPPMMSTFTSDRHPGKSGWKLGELVYYETFDDLAEWQAEGRLSATAREGTLLIECGEAREDRGNVWSVHEFSSPFYFEFRFRKLSGRTGLNLIFWNARTIDGADFFSVPRGWSMQHVINGNMESYHISYSRGGTGITNFHKNPNFHDLVQDVPDPLADPGTDWHWVGVYQNGSHMMFFENGTLVHDVDEAADLRNLVCLREGAHTGWEVENASGTMCPGLDARKDYTPDSRTIDLGGQLGRSYSFTRPNPGQAYTYTSGHIGFRHQNGITLYDDFRVWKLVPPSTP